MSCPALSLSGSCNEGPDERRLRLGGRTLVRRHELLVPVGEILVVTEAASTLSTHQMGVGVGGFVLIKRPGMILPGAVGEDVAVRVESVAPRPVTSWVGRVSSANRAGKLARKPSNITLVVYHGYGFSSFRPRRYRGLFYWRSTALIRSCACPTSTRVGGSLSLK